MKHSVQDLVDDLSKFQNLLERGTMLSFSADERESLLAESKRHMLRLEGVGEGFLAVGLLGGTGVGKSSIMNALAGSTIASTSYRRPHTDQVLIYHHEASLLPAEVQRMEIPWREITHQVDSIRQILLCDLPDFDSLVGTHRDRVIKFLEHLDVLVWVTSPEKYADERFYSFLQKVPKARQNFYFIINKTDLFFDGLSIEEGYQGLAKVTANFQQYLIENGVSYPLIYAISVSQISSQQVPAPWNQFASLRQQIFQHRDIKEVMVIKAANLDVEVQLLLSILQRENQNLLAVSQVVSKFTEELEADRTRWVSSGAQSFELLLESRFKKQIPFRMNDFGYLVGPGRLLATLISDWKSWLKSDYVRGRTLSLVPDGMVGSPLQRELEKLEDRLAHKLLSRGLPAVFQNHLTGVLSARNQWNDLKDRLNHLAETWFIGAPIPAFIGFRSVQYLVYITLFAALFLTLGGDSAWLGFLENPGWAEFTGLVSATIHNVFSPRGLAALLSYMLINLFFGFRFYGRGKKLLQRYSQKFIESLKVELGRIWEAELDSIVSQLKDYDQRLYAQISAIRELHEKRQRD